MVSENGCVEVAIKELARPYQSFYIKQKATSPLYSYQKLHTHTTNRAP